MDGGMTEDKAAESPENGPEYHPYRPYRRENRRPSHVCQHVGYTVKELRRIRIMTHPIPA